MQSIFYTHNAVPPQLVLFLSGVHVLATLSSQRLPPAVNSRQSVKVSVSEDAGIVVALANNLSTALDSSHDQAKMVMPCYLPLGARTTSDTPNAGLPAFERNFTVSNPCMLPQTSCDLARETPRTFALAPAARRSRRVAKAHSSGRS